MSLQDEALFSAVGWVASEVRSGVLEEGNRRWAAFRFVWTPRRYDRAKGTFVDSGGGNFVTVWCNWELAHNITSCLQKGDPVLVVGRLRIEEKRIEAKELGPRTYGEAEVTAHAVGHNLAWGTSAFRRTRQARAAGRTEPLRWDAAAEAEAGSGVEDGQAA